MWPVYFIIIILHIPQCVGCLHYAGRLDLDILFCLDRNIHQHRVGKLTQCVISIADHRFVAIDKLRRKSRLLHVERLRETGNIFWRNVGVVHLEPHVQQVEAFQKIAHPPPSIKIIGTRQHNVLYLKRQW